MLALLCVQPRAEYRDCRILNKTKEKYGKK
jgi:hypothetical protein